MRRIEVKTWMLASAAVTIALLSGCAQSRPCMIIPAQIELAESARDQAKTAYDRKLEDVTRSLNNMEVSRGRLERLQAERTQLQGLLGDGGGKN